MPDPIEGLIHARRFAHSPSLGSFALGNVSDGDTPNIPMAYPLCFAVDTPPSR